MMKARLPALFKSEGEYEILGTFLGQTLEGKGYAPVLPYFSQYKGKGAFKVLCDKYVTEESGTGVVHQVRTAISPLKDLVASASFLISPIRTLGSLLRRGR